MLCPLAEDLSVKSWLKGWRELNWSVSYCDSLICVSGNFLVFLVFAHTSVSLTELAFPKSTDCGRMS